MFLGKLTVKSMWRLNKVYQGPSPKHGSVRGHLPIRDRTCHRAIVPSCLLCELGRNLLGAEVLSRTLR